MKEIKLVNLCDGTTKIEKEDDKSKEEEKTEVKMIKM